MKLDMTYEDTWNTRVRDPSSETSRYQILEVNKDFFKVFDSNRLLLNGKQC